MYFSICFLSSTWNCSFICNFL